MENSMRLLSFFGFAFAILFLSNSCFCSDVSPLVVQLSTEQQSFPLFLADFDGEHSNFDANYIQQLEKILQFDLSQSGYVHLLSHNTERSQLASQSINVLGNANRWKVLNALYVVKVQLNNKQMRAFTLDIDSNSLKTLDGFTLTGNLNQDRQQVHLLADGLIKKFFGFQGIASTHFLYTRKYKNNDNKWLSEIWECDYDGANPKKIINDEGGYCVTPVYMPPKPGHKTNSFFYVSYKIGQPKIYMAGLTNDKMQRLTSLRGNQLMPAVAPKRNKIAFISDITGNPDLFLQDFSPETGPIGKPRQIFTCRQATQGSPAFSPDGYRIAFVSNKDGSPRIYLIDIPPPEAKLQEIKAQLITRVNRESSAPCWSPDGTKLAFCARNGGIRQIWIYDFESDEEWQLTQGPDNKENPSWAPNSLHIIYNTTTVGKAELYMINLNSRQSTKIEGQLSGEKRFPAWEPKA